jgi:putative transposase
MRYRKPRGPRPIPLKLSRAQGAILEKIIGRPSNSQQLVKRAQIIQYADKGLRNEEIARKLRISAPTVIKWRRRWATSQEQRDEIEKSAEPSELEEALIAVLADESRSGAPLKFQAEEVCQIMAIACEEPSASGRPVSEWTPRELADEVVKRNIVSSISVRQTGRFLKMRRI